MKVKPTVMGANEGNSMNIADIQKEREIRLQQKAYLQQQMAAVEAWLDEEVTRCDMVIKLMSRGPAPTVDFGIIHTLNVPPGFQDPVARAQTLVQKVELPEPPKVESKPTNVFEAAQVITTPVLAAAPVTPVVAPVETEESEEDEVQEDESSSAPNGVELGRGGKPKLIDAMIFVLEKYGHLHPNDIAANIEKHQLAPNSKKLVDYIRYTLSKNKAFFAKVPNERGKWMAAPRKGAAPAPKAEASAPVAKSVSETDREVYGDRPAEVLEVEAFREREKTGTIRMSPEEARSLVESMTDPKQRQKKEGSLVSAV